MRVLVTGSDGFIGSHLCISLLKNKKNKVIGLDNHNSYYEPSLKENRLKQFKTNRYVISKNPYYLETKKFEGIDIDTEDEFKLAQFIYKNKKKL